MRITMYEFKKDACLKIIMHGQGGRGYFEGKTTIVASKSTTKVIKIEAGNHLEIESHP